MEGPTSNLARHPNGIFIRPFWRILGSPTQQALTTSERVIRIEPGQGFGDGTHETTRVCLEAIGHLGKNRPQALDFGSGTGILSIALAQLGSVVDAVEIDPLAVAEADRNAKQSGVRDKIHFSLSLDQLPPGKTYSLIVANILRPVLLEYAEALASRLEPSGILILSGLAGVDSLDTGVRYGRLIGYGPQVYERGDWRALVWPGRGAE